MLGLLMDSERMLGIEIFRISTSEISNEKISDLMLLLVLHHLQLIKSLRFTKFFKNKHSYVITIQLKLHMIFDIIIIN